MVITTSDAQLRIDIAEMVQNQLAAVGIRTSVEVLENATYLDKIVNGGFQMYILTWPTYTGDADYGLSDTFHTGSATWANTARYSNPEVDALLDIGANTIDQDARRDAYYKAQELIVEELPVGLPLEQRGDRRGPQQRPGSRSAALRPLLLQQGDLCIALRHAPEMR